MSLGSLAEIETQLIISSRLGYTPQQEAERFLKQADEIGKMLRGLQKALDGKLARRERIAP